MLLGNYIGIDVTGTFPIGNLGDGVSISTGRNQIGDASYAGDNVISGNTGDGLVLQGAFATQNAVQGNAIGPSGPDYNVQIGNTGDGVSLAAGSSGTTIANAVISASGRHGIEISGAGTRNNIFQSNFINFNHWNGVEISGTGATNNILQVNSVGYNQENGIHILGAETSGNLVLGCTIQQNALDGVRIENSPGNSIGGTGAGNGISGNGSGVEITGAAATGNLVLGNDIFNNVDGVKIEGAPGNSIGGAVNHAGNAHLRQHWRWNPDPRIDRDPRAGKLCRHKLQRVVRGVQQPGRGAHFECEQHDRGNGGGCGEHHLRQHGQRHQVPSLRGPRRLVRQPGAGESHGHQRRRHRGSWQRRRRHQARAAPRTTPSAGPSKAPAT